MKTSGTMIQKTYNASCNQLLRVVVSFSLALLLLSSMEVASGFTFVPLAVSQSTSTDVAIVVRSNRRRDSSLIVRHAESGIDFTDPNVLQGIGIGLAGLFAGIGLVAFTEGQGERSRQRGAGLSDSMSTRIAGKLLEDVPVSSVSDLSSLTGQLERALMETGAAKEQDFVVSEETKKKIQEDSEEGW